MKLAEAIPAGFVFCSMALPSGLVAQHANSATAAQIDPFLFDEVADAAARASAAELDATRGPSNALEILRSRRGEVASDQRLAQALDLRIAGTVLRSHFLSNQEVPAKRRWEQALSTFSRLDIGEPGLSAWILAAARHSRDDDFEKPTSETATALWPDRSSMPTTAPRPSSASKRRVPNTRTKLSPLGGPPPRIGAALLVRGDRLDRKDIARRLIDAFTAVGIDVVMTGASDAAFVLKVSAEDAVTEVEDGGNVPTERTAAGQRAVRVSLDIERQRGGKVTWRHGLYRTSKAASIDGAIDASLTWLTRIGARDMLFRWLGETTFPGLLDFGVGPSSIAGPRAPEPSRHGGHGHEHGRGPTRGLGHGLGPSEDRGDREDREGRSSADSPNRDPTSTAVEEESRRTRDRGISPVGEATDTPLKVTLPRRDAGGAE